MRFGTIPQLAVAAAIAIAPPAGAHHQNSVDTLARFTIVTDRIAAVQEMRGPGVPKCLELVEAWPEEDGSHILVCGEVADPAFYEAEWHTPYVEAVALAGGVTFRARQTPIIWRAGTGFLEWHGHRPRGALEPTLSPGDILFIPQISF